MLVTVTFRPKVGWVITKPVPFLSALSSFTHPTAPRLSILFFLCFIGLKKTNKLQKEKKKTRKIYTVYRIGNDLVANCVCTADARALPQQLISFVCAHTARLLFIRLSTPSSDTLISIVTIYTHFGSLRQPRGARLRMISGRCLTVTLIDRIT